MHMLIQDGVDAAILLNGRGYLREYKRKINPCSLDIQTMIYVLKCGVELPTPYLSMAIRQNKINHMIALIQNECCTLEYVVQCAMDINNELMLEIILA